MPLGTFIPGRLGTSLTACRDNNKHGGHVTRMVRTPQGESIKFYRLTRDTEAQAAYTRFLRMMGINWHSGLICAEYWSRGYRDNASADFPDVPLPASQLVALQKKLEQAKAQLERKATKPVKRKVSSLERKRFLAKRCSVISGSKKRQAPAERDLPTTKRSRKLSKRQLSTRLGASKEDKQLLLTEQPTNAQDMVKKLRTENLSVKVKL